jgi:hypothetical protein
LVAAADLLRLLLLLLLQQLLRGAQAQLQVPLAARCRCQHLAAVLLRQAWMFPLEQQLLQQGQQQQLLQLLDQQQMLQLLDQQQLPPCLALLLLLLLLVHPRQLPQLLPHRRFQSLLLAPSTLHTHRNNNSREGQRLLAYAV